MRNSQGSPQQRMSEDNLENFGASGDDTARYDDRGGENSVAQILERLEGRMNNLELHIKASQRSESSTHALLRQAPYLPQGHCPPHVAESSKSQTPYQAKDSLSGPEFVTAGTPGPNELQERFNSIKNTVDKVILPVGFKLHDARTGIKREDQQTLNVISKCGRYVETALKLISNSKEGKSLDLEPIVTTLHANINYLQDEYAALLVKGKFDDSTAQFFRSLQKANSGFDNQSINNVRIAAELTGISNKSASNRGNYRQTYRGNQSYNNFNPRFSSYNRFSSYRDRRDDLFHNIQGPRFRNPGRGQPWQQNRDQD